MKWCYIVYRGTHPVSHPLGRRLFLTIYGQDIADVTGVLFDASWRRPGHFTYPRVLSGVPEEGLVPGAPYYENFIDIPALSQFTGILPVELTKSDTEILYGVDPALRAELMRSMSISWLIAGPGEKEMFPGAILNLSSDDALRLLLVTPAYSVFERR